MGIKNLYKNNGGFGLIEILVATALLGIVSVGVMDIVSTSVKSSRSVDQSMQMTAIESSLISAFSNTAVCRSVLRGTPLPDTEGEVGETNAPGTPSGIYTYDLSTGTPLRAILTTGLNQGVNVAAIRLRTDEILTDASIPNQQTKRFTIFLDLEKTGSVTGPDGRVVVNPDGSETRTIRAREIPGTVTYDTSVVPNSVISCGIGVSSGGSSVTEQDVCEDVLGGTYDVSLTPRCRLNTFAVLNPPGGTYPATPGIHAVNGPIAAGADGITSAGAVTANAGILTPTITGTTGDISLGSNLATRNNINLMAPGELTAGGGLFVNAVSASPATGVIVVNSRISATQGIRTATISAVGAGASITVSSPVLLSSTIAASAGDIIIPTGGINIQNGNINALRLITPSDSRLKTNIKIIPHALEKVLQLRGVTFDWKNPSPLRHHDMGVIAQDVEKVAPELIHQMENGTKSVAYPNMVGLLIEAIKEQQKQINDLKKEVETLKKQGK